MPFGGPTPSIFLDTSYAIRNNTDKMFRGRKTKDGPDWDQEISAIVARIDGLVTQLDDLSKLVRDLEFEWNETYEKFRRLHMKLSKREKRESAAELLDEDPNGNGDPNSVHTDNPLAQRLLSRR